MTWRGRGASSGSLMTLDSAPLSRGLAAFSNDSALARIAGSEASKAGTPQGSAADPAQAPLPADIPASAASESDAKAVLSTSTPAHAFDAALATISRESSFEEPAAFGSAADLDLLARNLLRG
jgi:hypothetical protein